MYGQHGLGWCAPVFQRAVDLTHPAERYEGGGGLVQDAAVHQFDNGRDRSADLDGHEVGDPAQAETS